MYTFRLIFFTGMNSEKIQKFLLYAKKVDKYDENCIKNYSVETNGLCKNYYDCIDTCILNEHLKNHKKIPTKVKIEKSKFNPEILNLKFKDEYIQNLESSCKEIYRKGDCYYTNIYNVHLYNGTLEKNKIRINLNPFTYFEEKTNLASLRKFFLYLIPYIHLVTSFSFIGYLKARLKGFKITIKILINIAYPYTCLVLINYATKIILDDQLESVQYSKYSEEIDLPNVIICWSIADENNITLYDFDGKSTNELEKYLVMPNDVFDSVRYLNSSSYEFQNLNMNITGIEGFKNDSKMNYIYFLNKRCIEFNLTETYKRSKYIVKGSKTVFEAKINTLKIIDQRVSWFLNSRNYFTSECEYFGEKNVNYSMPYQIFHSVVEDDFAYFREPSQLFTYIFGSDKSKNQIDYYLGLIIPFNKIFNHVTTFMPLKTSIPELLKMKIKNKVFYNYVYLSTLASRIEDFRFKSNFDRELMFLNLHLKYIQANQTIITLTPDFSNPTNFKSNKSSVLNFFVVLLSMISIFFNVSLVNLPSYMKFWFILLLIFVRQFFILLAYIFTKLSALQKKFFIFLRCR